MQARLARRRDTVTAQRAETLVRADAFVARSGGCAVRVWKVRTYPRLPSRSRAFSTMRPAPSGRAHAGREEPEGRAPVRRGSRAADRLPTATSAPYDRGGARTPSRWVHDRDEERPFLPGAEIAFDAGPSSIRPRSGVWTTTASVSSRTACATAAGGVTSPRAGSSRARSGGSSDTWRGPSGGMHSGHEDAGAVALHREAMSTASASAVAPSSSRRWRLHSGEPRDEGLVLKMPECPGSLPAGRACRPVELASRREVAIASGMNLWYAGPEEGRSVIHAPVPAG
jgi:hypothetical protein